jgi:hypothetical protein
VPAVTSKSARMWGPGPRDQVVDLMANWRKSGGKRWVILLGTRLAFPGAC